MRIPAPTRLLAALCLPSLVALPAMAAEELPAPGGEPPTRLPEQVVVGARTRTDTLDAPYAVGVVGAGQVAEQGSFNFPEALESIPGVSVQQTGRAMGSPYIRGFTGYHNVLMVDGVRVNNALFRSGPNQYWGTVDVRGLERIEVARGAASVMYGSDAIGGAVDAQTVRPRAGASGPVGGRVFLRGASAEQGFTGRVENYGQWDGVGYVVGGTADAYGDLRAGGGVDEQGNTGYHDHAGDVKLVFAVGEHADLTLFHQRFDLLSSPRTHATTSGIAWNGSAVGTDNVRDFDQHRDLTYVQFASSPGEGPLKEVKASLSWQEQTETQYRVTNAFTRHDLDEARVGTLGAFAHATVDAGGAGELTFGFDAYHDHVNTAAYRNGAPREVQGDLGADEASYLLAGLFVQDRVHLGKRLDAVGGVRFNYVKAEADRVADTTTAATTDALAFDKEWTAVNGSLRLVYALVPEQVSLFGGWSQGFRAPNLSDLTSLNVFGSGNRETVNLDLEPEHYDNFELGAKGRHRRASWGATVFHTLIGDGIVRHNTGVPNPAGGTIWQKTNAGDGFMSGVELEAAVDVTEEVKVYGGASWVYGRQDTYISNGTRLIEDYTGKLPPVKVDLGVRFQPVGRTWYVFGQLTWAGEADHVNAADDADTQRVPPGGTPGYLTGTVGAGWQPTRLTDISLVIENITNEDYRVHGSGTNAPGLNAVLSVTRRF